jgi:hypothetical protein
MRVRLTKLSDAKHRLALIRDDGACESIELASRSFLWHDFLHYAVETNAGLHQSFWGLLAGGRTLADLHDPMSEGAGAAKASASEAAVTEAVVGVLTDAVRERGAPGAAIAGLSRWFEARNRELPAWLSADFVERVGDHMRRLMGEWRAVPFGGEMELVFPRPEPMALRPGRSQQKARPEGRGGLARNEIEQLAYLISE